MRPIATLCALAVAAARVTVQSANTTSTPGTSDTSADPCALISSRAVSYLSTNPNATRVELQPSEVYACLHSVPYDRDTDVKQIAWIENLFQFQSTLAYLKDPPPSYPLPAVDIFDELRNISASIASGQYTNEYDIELDLDDLIVSAYDGHFNYVPFLVGNFYYIRGLSLVSVSLDGVQVPKVYVLSDILGLSTANSTPSAVTTINGQDVSHIAQYGQGLQDLDALYNSVFDSPASAGANSGIGYGTAGRFTKHDDTTLYTFDNGTSRLVNATAVITPAAATAIPETGKDYYKLLTSSASNPSSSSLSATPTSSSSPSLSPSTLPLGPQYPPSTVERSQDFVSGYFMNETENSDVAVLNIASFDAEELAIQFQTLEDSAAFLAECETAGKRRLIIDVRNNPGGSIYLGYALFQQLFPDIVPYSGVRMRDSAASNLLGEIASTSSVQNDINSELAVSVFNIQTLATVPGDMSFDSWQQFYGPIHQHGDNFSNIGSWNYSDPDYNFGSRVASVVDNATSLPPQVFASEDITLLTDGQCSSTCTDFSNLLINQGRVKTVTVGGRPNNQPMAVVGGVQGGQILYFSDIQEGVSEAIAFQANGTGNSTIQTSQIQNVLVPLASPPPIATLPGKTSVSVNFLDSIAQNDTSATPLQFTGGIAADCRFYYMPADYDTVSNTWARVARGVKAGGSGLCINGTVTKFLQDTTAGNGSAPLTFRGSASVTGASRVLWTFSLVAMGSMAVMFV